MDGGPKPSPKSVADTPSSRVLDLNKSKLMYEINVGATGLTGNLMIPAPLNEKSPDPNNPANYYFRLLVYWSPAPSAANVKVFNGTFKYGGTPPDWGHKSPQPRDGKRW